MKGQSPKVYAMDAFSYRVQFAAAVIAKAGTCSRAFDTCFEMWDGDAVVAALVRRAKANPGGALARNFSRYLNPESAEKTYQMTAHLTRRGLTKYAAETRAQRQRESDAMFAAIQAEREKQAAPA